MHPTDTLDSLATYVIHAQRVIAEDLKDILGALGLRDIQLAGRITDVPPGRAALVVVAATAVELATTPHLETWTALGVPVVVVDGRTGISVGAPNVAVLAQPFRSEDVASVLAGLRVL